MGILEEIRRAIGFHRAMRRLRKVPVTTADFLAAFDEARERSPNRRFAQECRAIAELELRDLLGVRLFDA